MAGTKGYKLVANEYHETTSKPGEPFTYKTHTKGATVQLNPEQAERLLAAGAVEDTSATTRSGKPGGQTKAPKGSAPGVGDGDADKGSIGDGGPDPQGTGSSAATGVTGGPADGQGAGDDTASSGNADDTTTGGDQGDGSTPKAAKKTAAKKAASSSSQS